MISSDTPWISRNTQGSGTTDLYGHRIGRQGVCSEVSLISQAYQASPPLMTSSMKIDGKKNTMYEVASMMPLVFTDHFS